MSFSSRAVANASWCRYGRLVIRSEGKLSSISTLDGRFPVQLETWRPLFLGKRVGGDKAGPLQEGVRQLKGAGANYCQGLSVTQSFSSSRLVAYHSPKVAAAVPQIIQRRCAAGRAVGEKTAAAMAETGAQFCDPDSITFLNQEHATQVDEMLMGDLGFSVDQLMELAGLSVASAISEVYGPKDHSRVLVIAGPGNNGGDGLVAARHLHHFGYKVAVCYPKRTNKPLYHGLVTQLESLAIPFLSDSELPGRLKDDFDVIVDAMFGFSFKGTPRPPFDAFLQRLIVLSGSSTQDAGVPTLVSIDIPSGWHVEEGDIEGTGLSPDMLVSLTAPKLCAKNFKGAHHFLGGRFVPPALVQKFGLKLPAYPGALQCVRIGKAPKSPPVDVASLREVYDSRILLEEHVNSDPIQQFQEWFEEAVNAKLHDPNAMTLATANAQGKPSARVVLLKGYDERGFVWYTNYDSRKAADIAENPFASLVFFWEPLHRSIRVEGLVEKVSDKESEDYFHSRPRGSQLGAMASEQSTVIHDRTVLDHHYEDLLRKYSEGTQIPRPDFWGGFRLRPSLIEFWQGRPSRLHDRLRYTLVKDDGFKQSWFMDRLSP